MTQEKKAKRYDEVVNKLSHFIAQGVDPLITKADVQDFFPELVESEDEKIKKALLEYFGEECDTATINGIYCYKIYDWLEKQGEKNPTPKVEPKFKVGDWCIDNEDGVIFQIVKVLDNTYTYKTIEGKEYSCTYYSLENDARRWTIQDAKDGDVLLFEGYYNSIVLFQGIGINGKGRINYHCKCDLGNYSFGIQGDVACLGTIEKDAEHYHPATKELRDILFKKMKEAGYKWDVEKKELKRFEQVDDFDTELNALLKKYEHLSKKELQEPLEFYLDVIRNDLDVVRENPNHHEGWVNVFRGKHGCYVDREIWEFEENANTIGKEFAEYIASVKIEWEEQH